MSTNSFFAKFLRFIGILLMGITALFTIAGGLGTTCVALNPTGFGEGMAPIAPFQWLYIIFVIVTTAIGIMAARAVCFAGQRQAQLLSLRNHCAGIGNRGRRDPHAGLAGFAR